MAELVLIEDIKVKDRIREDLGDIESLAEDIDKNGLISPIAITPTFELIAGERRLEAYKFLGRYKIMANMMAVKDYQQMLEMEIAENEQRKQFTPAERVKYGLELEKVEAMKARERQEVGINQYTESEEKRVKENFPEASKGQTRDIVAQKVGLGSGRNYEKSKEIVEKAPEPVKEAWNKGEISTHKAHTITRMPGTDEEKVRTLEDEELQRKLKAVDDKHKLADVIGNVVDNPKMPYHKEITQEHLDAYYACSPPARTDPMQRVRELDRDCDLIIGICQRIKELNMNYKEVRVVK